MKTFFFSDPHFGHANVIGYQDRPFRSVGEMDETIIRNWNSVVSEDDHVFLLGDVTFYKGEKAIEVLYALNGKISLILGNHDQRKRMEETDRFEHISSYPVLFDEFFLLSHEPVFLTEQSPFCNIHGHFHQAEDIPPFVAPLNINVSAECINYTPISYSDVKRIEGVRPRMSKFGKMRPVNVERHAETNRLRNG